MKVVFIGAVNFSYRILRKLVSRNVELVGVVSMSDASLNADYYDFTSYCQQQNLSHLTVNDINSQSVFQWLTEKSPDVIFCIGWSRLLRGGILNLAPHGVIGYHPALLPNNKGRHPIIWALVLGLEETGSTFFLMDEGVDSGEIVSQDVVPIEYSDTAATLYDKLAVCAENQIDIIVEQLKTGSLQKMRQDGVQANYWRKRKKADGKIDFRMSSRAIYNLVRALSAPYPGAHLEHKGNEVRVWRVREHLGNSNLATEPGKILDVQARSVFIKAGEGVVELIQHEFQELPQVGEYL
jgi:methionyl-tRNA formyltransferase